MFAWDVSTQVQSRIELTQVVQTQQKKIADLSNTDIQNILVYYIKHGELPNAHMLPNFMYFQRESFQSNLHQYIIYWWYHGVNEQTRVRNIILWKFNKIFATWQEKVGSSITSLFFFFFFLFHEVYFGNFSEAISLEKSSTCSR